MVIRLDGTNAEEGRAILATVESERVVSQPTMLDAARKAVELAAKESAGGASRDNNVEAATAPAGHERGAAG
jgi:hypothetical protein